MGVIRLVILKKIIYNNNARIEGPPERRLCMSKKTILLSIIVVMLLFLIGCKDEVLTETSENVFTGEECKEEMVVEIPSSRAEPTIEDSLGTNTFENEIIFAYICGAIVNPGVYECNLGERIVELVNLAGGFTEDAAPEYVNLARVIQDGEQIVIYTKDEVKELQLTLKQNSNQVDNQKDLDSSTKKININVASVEELCEIPGIGQTRAKQIIEYRETYGTFSCIEDIMNVQGIKEGMFSKIKSSISVS